MISNQKMEQLKKLKALYDEGILNQAEFEAKKAQILGTPSEAAPPDGAGEETLRAPVGPDIPDGKKDRQKKPIYKRPGFIALAVIVLQSVLISAFGGGDGEKKAAPAQSAETSVSSQAEEPESEPAEPEKAEAKLVSISAEYTGDTEEGVVLDESNDGIRVTGTYDDGSTEPLSGWTVVKAKTLKAGKKAKIHISYEGLICKLKVKCTTIAPEEYKESCETIAYDKLARQPDKYEGKDIKIFGKVIQVLEDSGSSEINLRVATKKDEFGGYYDDVVLVTYTYGEGDDKILEDDMITLWGSYGNTYTYESTMGGKITVPLLNAKYYELAS